jgi:glycogen synthase
MTQTLEEAGLALPLWGSPVQMAQQVRNYLSDAAALELWSQRARHYCNTELSAMRVATRYVELYRKVIANAASLWRLSR